MLDHALLKNSYPLYLSLVLCHMYVTKGDMHREFSYMESTFLLDFRVMIASHRMSDAQGEAPRNDLTRLHKRLMVELGLLITFSPNIYMIIFQVILHRKIILVHNKNT